MRATLGWARAINELLLVASQPPPPPPKQLARQSIKLWPLQVDQPEQPVGRCPPELPVSGRAELWLARRKLCCLIRAGDINSHLFVLARFFFFFFFCVIEPKMD